MPAYDVTWVAVIGFLLSSVNCSNVTTSDLIDLAPRVTGHSPWSILKNQNLSRDCHHRDCHVTLSRKKKPDLNIHFMVAKRPESRIELRFREKRPRRPYDSRLTGLFGHFKYRSSKIFLEVEIHVITRLTILELRRIWQRINCIFVLV